MTGFFLDEIAANLGYAAGAGGAHIADEAVQSARNQSELMAAFRAPGPGLRSILARHGGRASATGGTAVSLAQATGTGARIAVEQGLDIVMRPR